ncbi:hypothetical protein [Aquimarina sediminis]|uniref:hypothetical protein n=1 Tax=Aquimarina sediminis TaxID=2070536 RepID=UPI000FFEAA90|nr:hypothetical protein [Aquimarina sediminis]
MLDNILNFEGTVILKRETQKSIHGGTHGCQNEPRKCFSDSDCCSGICGIERHINGRLVVLSVCAA